MFEMRPYNRTRHAAPAVYDPFRMMDEFERRMFGEPFSFEAPERRMPIRTDITDLGSDYLLESDLPGFNKEDIKLSLEGDTLTLSAERKLNREEKDSENRVIRCERSCGSYRRSFDVSGIDTDRITAKYENGVLRVTLPKLTEEPVSSRTLEIE